MNEKQIECFMAVAETLNFTQAAKRTYMSQPSISRLIGTFEQELKLSLFYRTNKAVCLTPAGVIMYDLFRKLSAEYEAEVERARNIHSGMEGKLKVGLPANLDMDELWEDVIPSFQKKHPNICLDYECISSEKKIFERIEDGEFDVSIVHTNNCMDSKKIVSDVVFNTRMKLVCGITHPIAEKGFFDKDDLEREKIWTVFPKELQIELLREMYAHFGVNDFHVISAGDFNTALVNVRMGNGILYIDPITKHLDERFFVQYDLPEQFGDISFSVIWSKENMNPALPMLLEFLNA